MAGSLIKIDEVNVTSAVASVSLGNFSADYNVYKLVITNMQTSNDAETPFLRLHNSSGANTSANYDEAFKFLRTNTPYVDIGNVNQTKFKLGGTSLGTNTGENLQCVIYFFNTFNASEYSFLTQEASLLNSSGYLSGAQGGGTLTVAEQHLSVSVFMETNNIASGRFVLYGLRK